MYVQLTLQIGPADINVFYLFTFHYDIIIIDYIYPPSHNPTVAIDNPPKKKINIFLLAKYFEFKKLSKKIQFSFWYFNRVSSGFPNLLFFTVFFFGKWESVTDYFSLTQSASVCVEQTAICLPSIPMVWLAKHQPIATGLIDQSLYFCQAQFSSIFRFGCCCKFSSEFINFHIL